MLKCFNLTGRNISLIVFVLKITNEEVMLIQSNNTLGRVFSYCKIDSY